MLFLNLSVLPLFHLNFELLHLEFHARASITITLLDTGKLTVSIVFSLFILLFCDKQNAKIEKTKHDKIKINLFFLKTIIKKPHIYLFI